MNNDDGAANNTPGRKTRYTSLIDNNMNESDIKDVNSSASGVSYGRTSHTNRVRFIDDAAPDVVAEGVSSWVPTEISNDVPNEISNTDSHSLHFPTLNSPAWVPKGIFKVKALPNVISKALTKSASPENEEKPDFDTYKNVTRASIFSEKVREYSLMKSQSDTYIDSSSFCRGDLLRQEGKQFSTRSINTTHNEADHAIVALVATQLRTNYLFMSLKDDEIIDLAHKFEIVSYDVGATIIEQDSIGSPRLRGSVDDNRYYYIVVDGDCKVVKDGKQVDGKFGVIEKGTPFGERKILFDKPTEVSIIASKPPIGENSITVFRLKAKDFLDIQSDDEIKNLRDRVTEIHAVVNTISGVDTKIEKGAIIAPYRPSSRWLLRRWRGTILQYVWMDIIIVIVYATLLELFMSWTVDGVRLDEGSEDNTVIRIYDIGGGWFQLSGLTTFVLAFFLSDAYKFWKTFYETTRGIQGRLCDISLVLASNAPRRESDGKITVSALAALDDISRLQTLVHQLFWCSLISKFNCLLRPEGISYLLSRGLISRSEYTSLIEVGANGHGIYHACLTWLSSRITIAQKKGELELDHAAMIAVYDNVTKLRGLMATLSDMYDGRMPLAYIHFVNMLITVYLLLSPLALFPKFWFYSIPYIGILTLFYKGIFQLSMMFLDPVDNDKEHQKWTNQIFDFDVQTVGFDVGVLIRESTMGSELYKGCAESLPKY